MSCSMMINVKCHAGLRVSIVWSPFGVAAFNHVSHELHVFFLIIFVIRRHKPFLEVIHASDSVVSIVGETFEAFL